MNDFSELENQLKKLRPIPPSENLTTQIERALAESGSTRTAEVLPRARRLPISWLGLGLGLAAAALFLIFARVDFNRPANEKMAIASISPVPIAPPINAAGAFVPVGLTQVVYNTRDEGLQFPTDSKQPMRRMRSQRRETLQWRNPTTGASLRVSYPSEEISLISVSGQ